MSKLRLFGQNIMIVVMTLIVAVSIATVAMIGVYSIPTEPIKNNVVYSLQIYRQEKDWPRWATYYVSSQLDNCTDAMMLATALYPPTNSQNTLKSIIENAMLNPRYGHRTPFKSAEALVRYFDGVNTPEIQERKYFRYWHGYLVFLKPMLLIFSADDIRMLNMMLQLFLLSLLLVKLYSIGGYRLALPCLVGIMILNPVSCVLSMQYAHSYYIILISCLLILQYKLYASSRYWYFFLLLGICLSFIDILLYPVVVLGFPLLLFIVLNNEELLPKMKKVMMASVCWGIGYIGMWCGKWVMATLLTEADIFSDVYNQMKFRLGGSIPRKSYINVIPSKSISLNLDIFYRNTSILVCGVVVLLVIVFIIYRQRYKVKLQKSLIIPLLWVAVYPFIWFALLKNHSIMHAWFTFKLFSVTTLAVLYSIVYSFKEINMQGEAIQNQSKDNKKRKKKC